MGYEVISKAGNGGLLEPLGLINFGSCSEKNKCDETNSGCNSGCPKGTGCDIDVPVNGSCGGGNKDFKCTRNGGCNPCMSTKSSRFSQY